MRPYLPGHTIATAFEMGWAEFGKGDLLLEAEAQFNALVTTDQNLRYQQNLANRRLAILVLPFASGIVLQDEITLTLIPQDGKMGIGMLFELKRDCEVVVCENGFKNLFGFGLGKRIFCLVTVLSHRLAKQILGNRHSAAWPDIENVHLLSHRMTKQNHQRSIFLQSARLDRQREQPGKGVIPATDHAEKRINDIKQQCRPDLPRTAFPALSPRKSHKLQASGLICLKEASICQRQRYDQLTLQAPHWTIVRKKTSISLSFRLPP